MWMLVTTLCLQLDTKAADCRVEYRGPYPKQSDCREMMHVLDLARMVGHRDIRQLSAYYNTSASDIAKLLD